MSAAAGTAPPPEWFLARDGEQFGPLSDAELRKLVDFGHLKPSDLLWREGFPDWRSAKILLDDKSILGRPANPPIPSATPARQSQPAATAPVTVTPAATSGAPTNAATTPAASPTTATPAAAPAVEPPAAAPTQRVSSTPQPAAPVQARPAYQPQVQAPPQSQPQGQPTYAGPSPAQPGQGQPGQGIAPQAAPYPNPNGYAAPSPAPRPSPANSAAHTMAGAHQGGPQYAPQHAQRGPGNGPNHWPSQWSNGGPDPAPPGPASMGPLAGATGLNPNQAYPNQHLNQAQPSLAPPGAVPPARPMDLARPAAAAPVATATRHASAAPVHRDEDDDEDLDAEDGSRVVLWIKRIAVLLFFTLTLAAAGWYAYPHRDRIRNAINISKISSFGQGGSPIVGFKPTAEETDVAFQATPLWQMLKREFPEWYGERIKEAAALSKAQKSDAEIGKVMVQAMVALRRKHAGDALSATTPRLKSLAEAFADNLVRLRQVNVEACHAFISTGETSAEYLRLLADPSHSRLLQRQLIAVFEAIADGRKIPRIYPQPKQADYNLLVTALETRGWTEADMQLFSDSRRFGQAEPAKVCKMVTDWFQAQIELPEPDAQLRLLADALKPVVAG